MKIGIISDIHANSIALDAVLQDIVKKECKKIFCLGDYILAGYDPNGVVERLKKLEKTFDTEIIQGNTDLLLTHPRPDGFNLIYKVAPCMAYSYRDDLKITKKGNLEFVNKFPTKKELEIEGVKICICHGSPRRVDEGIHPDTPIETIEEMIQDTDADVILCGHTHIPAGFQLESGRTVVNVGSVGRPMTLEKEACYATLEINPETSEYVVEHVFVKYPHNVASKKIRERGLTGCEILAKMVGG